MRSVEPTLTLSNLPVGSELSIELYRQFHDVPTEVRLSGDENFLGLLLNIGVAFKFRISDVRTALFYKGQFNLLFLPFGLGPISVQPGELAVVLIKLTPGYLGQFSNDVPKISNFLKVYTKGFPASLANFNLFARADVTTMVQQLLNHNYRSGDENHAVFFQSRMMEVLTHSLNHIRNYGSIQLQRNDLPKIRKVRDYVLENLEKHDLSASMLADLIDMDKRRFEKIFRIVMNNTVYNFLIDERLNKALDLLTHTDLSVSEIATRVGYNAHQLFTRAFTLKYGYPPRDARKH